MATSKIIDVGGITNQSCFYLIKKFSSSILTSNLFTWLILTSKGHNLSYLEVPFAAFAHCVIRFTCPDWQLTRICWPSIALQWTQARVTRSLGLLGVRSSPCQRGSCRWWPGLTARLATDITDWLSTSPSVQPVMPFSTPTSMMLKSTFSW